MTGTADLFRQAGVFGGVGPRWFSIPSGRAFLDDLAAGLDDALGVRLSEALVLTPTRRGARAMARAFSQRAGEGALLLPQIRAIGDLDEGEPPFDMSHLALDLPPAVTSLRRRFELARLVRDHFGTDNAKRALELAEALSGFFDSLALEEIEAADRLDSLIHSEGVDQYVLDQWAEHWRVSAKFLAIAVREWPKRLEALGLMDPNQRQVALIRELWRQWRESPPQMPLVLAGSTGSAPAMADLMRAVAEAPMGAVVLPGVDLDLAEDAWQQITESHPQGTLKRLLDRHGVARQQVQVWPASVDADVKARARRRILNEALRPAEATRDWLSQIAALEAEGDNTIADGLDGLNRVQVAQDEDAASVIALLMREALETPDKVTALVTPDITLARRVSARLSRWGLNADSSAGVPLVHTVTGRFLLSLLSLRLTPHDPVQLLSVLRNPLCRYSDGAEALRGLEKALRGARPSSVEDILHRLAQGPEPARQLWARFVEGLARQPQTGTLAELLRAFLEWAEALTQEDGQSLWRGAAGAEAAPLLADIMREGADFPLSGPREFHDIVRHLLHQAKVRTGGNTHPRLLVLGAIEARLIMADRLILAGLEEGVWPQAAQVDPFLSRPMRARLGLPTPERRTGLSAHDFVQAASAPEVYLITRARREGDPQVESRWLWRLKTLAEGARTHLPTDPRLNGWARALDEGIDAPPETLMPASRPSPKPPVEVRPRELPVTSVETLIRDPYAVYARRILNLRTLDRLNEPVEARNRGVAIHRALERHVLEDMPLGAAGVQALTEAFETELLATGLSPAQMALQRPLLPLMAEQHIAFEAERRLVKPRIHIELKGQMTFEAPAGRFTLTARADRIEVADAQVDILDFKTGTLPAAKQVLAGFAPQLTLTAAIVRAGGFTDIPAAVEIGELCYVPVVASGRKPVRIASKEVSNTELASEAFSRLKGLVARYDRAGQAYRSWTAPAKMDQSGDYDQLARVFEWRVLGEADAEPEAGGEA